MKIYFCALISISVQPFLSVLCYVHVSVAGVEIGQRHWISWSCSCGDHKTFYRYWESNLANQENTKSIRFCLLAFCFSRQGFSCVVLVSWNCRTGCPWTHRDPPSSPSWALGLNVCDTTPGSDIIFYRLILALLCVFLCVCMQIRAYMCSTCRGQKCINQISGAGDTGGCKPLSVCVCWELNSGLLEEQQDLLSTVILMNIYHPLFISKGPWRRQRYIEVPYCLWVILVRQI